jgi:hypothetical protein
MQERMGYTWQFQLLFSWKYGELGISFKNPFTKVVTPLSCHQVAKFRPRKKSHNLTYLLTI